MEPQPPSPSDILTHIKGVENVHCVLPESESARHLYRKLFGPPAHTDGDWTEFKPGGFELAVTSGHSQKFVITFKTDRLDELRPKLETLLSRELEILHGDYGDYLEVCPDQGFCIHFFESHARKR